MSSPQRTWSRRFLPPSLPSLVTDSTSGDNVRSLLTHLVSREPHVVPAERRAEASAVEERIVEHGAHHVVHPCKRVLPSAEERIVEEWVPAPRHAEESTVSSLSESFVLLYVLVLLSARE